jgi:hypothetical protein
MTMTLIHILIIGTCFTLMMLSTAYSAMIDKGRSYCLLLSPYNTTYCTENFKSGPSASYSPVYYISYFFKDEFCHNLVQVLGDLSAQHHFSYILLSASIPSLLNYMVFLIYFKLWNTWIVVIYFSLKSVLI